MHFKTNPEDKWERYDLLKSTRNCEGVNRKFWPLFTIDSFQRRRFYLLLKQMRLFRHSDYFRLSHSRFFPVETIRAILFFNIAYNLNIKHQKGNFAPIIINPSKIFVTLPNRLIKYTRIRLNLLIHQCYLRKKCFTNTIF